MTASSLINAIKMSWSIIYKRQKRLTTVTCDSLGLQLFNEFKGKDPNKIAKRNEEGKVSKCSDSLGYMCR